MKKLLALALLLATIGCHHDNDKSINDVISQNNRYFDLTLSEYKILLESQKDDDPRHFDSIYYSTICNCRLAIAKLKTEKEYDTLFEKVKRLAYENKIKRELKPIASENKELLKNNLYVTLMEAIHAYKLQRPVSFATHCQLGSRFRIRKSIVKDSVNIDFYTSNPFQISVDSIKEGKNYLEDYISDQAYKVWSIRYKPTSKTSTCHGKIFFTYDSFSNLLFTEEFNIKTVQ